VTAMFETRTLDSFVGGRTTTKDCGNRASATSAVQPKCPIYSADAHRDLQSNRTRPIDGNATPIWQSRRRGVFDVDPLDR
jgi:hypothetical protein